MLVKETKTISKRGKDGKTHYRVVETGRMISVPYRSGRVESQAESAYYHGGYASEISFESYVRQYYKKG
jgi:hypothetical protein